MIRRPPRSTQSRSSAASDVYKRQTLDLDKKAYYQFALTPDSHPHFSRIWYARHVLNAESPLLKREIRDMIVQDGGKWDKGEFERHDISKVFSNNNDDMIILTFPLFVVLPRFQHCI